MLIFLNDASISLKSIYGLKDLGDICEKSFVPQTNVILTSFGNSLTSRESGLLRISIGTSKVNFSILSTPINTLMLSVISESIPVIFFKG